MAGQRTVILTGSSNLTITDASFETEYGDHKCESIKQKGMFNGGDYVLTCYDLSGERPIKKVTIYTNKGAFAYNVPESLRYEHVINM